MRRSVPPLLAVTAALVAVAPARAQTASSSTPSTAGKAGVLRFSLDATQPPVNGLVPRVLVLRAPGFRYDPRAVVGRCTKQLAVLNECPPSSRIGDGGLVIHVMTPDGERDVTPTLDLYLEQGSTKRVLALAFVAGYRVVPGTIDTSGGAVTLRFDPLPAPPAFAGVTYAMRSIKVRVGAHRTVTRYRTVTIRRKGKVVRRVRRVLSRKRLDLLHNPATCAGSWPSSMLLGFPDASQLTVPVPTPCR
jgi:hypothetical protein